jgi:hypothetical protein
MHFMYSFCDGNVRAELRANQCLSTPEAAQHIYVCNTIPQEVHTCHQDMLAVTESLLSKKRNC